MEKLNASHAVAAFESPSPALNTFLQRHALQSQGANAAQTYVAAVGDHVAGYYTLTVGQVVYDDAPERLAKGLARHPVPVLILARLAVDAGWIGRGLGAALLKDALRRASAAADIAGIRAVVVQAKDDDARRFYLHFGFEAFEEEPLHLYLLMKQVRQLF